MGKLVTLIVTNDDALAGSVQAILEKESLNSHVVTDINEVLSIAHQEDITISCLLMEIPEDPKEFERVLRKIKRDDTVKYIPCVGLLNCVSIKHEISRQLFFHVVTRETLEDTLVHTIESAQSDFKRYQALLSEVNSRTSAIGLIQNGSFKLQTLPQAEALTTMLSLACPDPAVVALGLSELLVNAIEHGNLDITYTEKSNLLESGEWDSEIQKRLHSEEFKDRYVEISFLRTNSKIQIIVKDQGKGFDWRKFMNADPNQHTAKHGRGIALAIAMGFNELSYNEKGNQVTATIMI